MTQHNPIRNERKLPMTQLYTGDLSCVIGSFLAPPSPAPNGSPRSRSTAPRRKGGGREEEVRTTVSFRFKEGRGTCVYEDPAMSCAVEDGKG